MTREELIAKLTESRTRKIELNWQQILSAFASSPIELKNQLVKAFNEKNGNLTLTTLMKMVEDKRKEMAAGDVEQILADDTLTTDDLIGLLD